MDIRFCGAMSEIDVLPMYVLFECFFCCGLGQAWHTSPAEYTWYTCTHTVIHSVHHYVCGVALVASTAVCYTQPGAYAASAPAPEAELSFWHKRVKDIFVVEAGPCLVLSAKLVFGFLTEVPGSASACLGSSLFVASGPG